MKLMPILHVSNVDRSLEFYGTLGFTTALEGRSGHWAEMSLGDAILGLHHADPLPPITGRIELCLLIQEPLERLLERLRVEQPFIVDEAFGRSFVLHDPDGNAVQINEHDASLYA
jgi:catechol-2,3-dioxygenase